MSNHLFVRRRAIAIRAGLCLLLAVAGVSALSGCAAAVVAGGAGTALLANDRRTSGAYVEDETIETRGENRIRAQFGEQVHVNITSFNRQVLLSGEVPDAATQAKVALVVGAIDNVRRVFNESALRPISSLADRSADAVITSDIKARMVTAQEFSANHIKVTTEAGVAYLLGLVTPAEGEAAARLTARVRGVKRVVTLFEYLPVAPNSSR